jgi:dipeptidyl aminopeptidase/acylaminoacyl peptidase
LHVVDRTGVDSLISTQSGTIATLAWTADGSSLVYRAGGFQDFYAPNGIWAELRELQVQSRVVSVLARGPSGYQSFVSPSGRYVAFVGDRSPVNEPTSPYIAIYDRVRRQTDVVTKASFRGYPYPEVTWMPDDKGLLFTAKVKAGRELLETHPLLSGPAANWSEPTTLASHGLWISAPQLSSDGQALSYVGLDLQGRRVLMLADSHKETPRRLYSLVPRVDELALGETRQITWNSADGLPVGGVLVRPPGFDPHRRYPLIVDIHGGPDGGIDLSGSILCMSPLEWQMWAAKGYLVLATDYRRSMVYGWDVFEQSRRHQDYFARDYDDIMSGVDYAIQHERADPRHMALIGHSWGGAEVLNAITRTRRFRAAIAYEGRANDLARYGTGWGVGGDAAADFQYGGKPWDVPQNYIQNSSAYRVQGVTTPTLLVVTEPSAFRADNEFMYTALVGQHVDTQLVCYPGENHLIFQPPNQRDLLDRAIRWIDNHI